jgi:hypothetical protein
MKIISILTITVLLLLASCSPKPAASVTTLIPGTVSEATAIVITGVPVEITSLPANQTPNPFPTLETPTTIPPLPSGLSLTELKYKVLEQFPDFFFCDPDFFPVARMDEEDLARQRFSELQANQEEFQAILSHNGLAGAAEFSDEQKLLIYQEHKKLAALLLEPAGEQYRFQKQTAKGEGQGFSVVGLIDGNGTVTIQERRPTLVQCPICLAAGTRIDTPGGPVAVEELRIGDLIWTVDRAGMRIAAPLLKTSRVSAPAGHQVVHLVLDDGRQLWASHGHPTADGRAVGELRAGDLLDGGLVVQIERLPYDQPATYDILPASRTGGYWANGILVGSTLALAR